MCSPDISPEGRRATAKDGCEANLNIEPEFFGVDDRSYIFARMRADSSGVSLIIGFCGF
jgi:hypothetical protein